MAELAMLVDSGVGSNLQVGGTMPARNFFDGPPTFLLCPHSRGHNECLLPTIEVSPSVGSAVCTSTGEVGRGAIQVMGPSAVPCRLLGY